MSFRFLKFSILFLFLFSFSFAFDYKVYISEILPSPEGPDEKEEWVEIFNGNDFGIDLSGWKISDKVGKTKTYIFPKGTKIPAKGFLILDRPTTKITLNNEGDELVLFNPSGEIVDVISYQKAPEGKSFSKTDSGWIWTSNLTPGSENFNPYQASQTEPANLSIEKEKPSATILPSLHPLFTLSIAILIALFSAFIFLIFRKIIFKKEIE